MNALLEVLNISKQNIPFKQSFFAEIFADSVKKILKGDSRITILHEKKYEYINSIIN